MSRCAGLLAAPTRRAALASAAARSCGRTAPWTAPPDSREAGQAGQAGLAVSRYHSAMPSRPRATGQPPGATGQLPGAGTGSCSPCSTRYRLPKGVSPDAAHLGLQGQCVRRGMARLLRLLDGRVQLAPRSLEERFPPTRIATGDHLRPAQLFTARFRRLRPRPFPLAQLPPVARLAYRHRLRRRSGTVGPYG